MTGVLTGEAAWNIVQKAIADKSLIQAFECANSSECVTALEVGARTGHPVAIIFTCEGSTDFAGPSLKNEQLQGAQLGAVVGAHLVRFLAPAYGASVLIHTRCPHEHKDWLDGLIAADQEFFTSQGEPLFTSHGLDCSCLPLRENAAACAKHLEKMKAMGLTFELAGSKPEEVLQLRGMLIKCSDRIMSTSGVLQAFRPERVGKRSAGIKVAVFSSKPYDEEWFEKTNQAIGCPINFCYFEARLGPNTLDLAKGCFAVCVFVNDDVSGEVVKGLAGLGVKLVTLRCAGFNNVDLHQAEEEGITVARVPAYSPDAVAEHAVSLMLALNRKIPQAWKKTRGGNFSLVGQLGFDMLGKKVGVIGTGEIGYIAARILKRGFGCNVVAYDVRKNPLMSQKAPDGLGIEYVELDEIFHTCDIITLHAPLMPSTHHVVNQQAIEKMKPGVMIINCSRGALVDTKALLAGLKSKIIGSAGVDVYEEESEYFYEDFSEDVITDDVFSRLLSFTNVIVTSHQAFFTKEAMEVISRTTLQNVIGVNRSGVPPKQNGKLETLVKAPDGYRPTPKAAVVPKAVGDVVDFSIYPWSPQGPEVANFGMDHPAGRIRVAMFSCKSHDKESFEAMNVELTTQVEFVHHETPLTPVTAPLAVGCYAVCVTIHDRVSAETMTVLRQLGVKVIALRCSSFEHVDVQLAEDLGIKVCHVPLYSPHAAAEHAVALITSLNRRLPQAYQKTRSGNFSLVGQMGCDLKGKKVGVVGTDVVGVMVARILKHGFDCEVMAYDVHKVDEIRALAIQYVDLDKIFKTCDIITIHAPLLPVTYHMINQAAIEVMKPGVMIINCSRGGLVDTKALLWGLKKKIIGGAGLDAYEEESAYFSQDFSHDVVTDDVFARLLSFPNVTVTAHQAFFTSEALQEIAKTTLLNIVGLHDNGEPPKQNGMLDTLLKP